MVIGLAGLPTAGKNAAGDILKNDFGFRLISFAEPLRQEVKSAIDLTSYFSSKDVKPASAIRLWSYVVVARDLGLDPWEKPTSPVMRRLLQLWGTEFRREQDPHYWAKKAHAEIAKSPGNWAITDVRFPNEKAICDFTIWIDRPGLTPSGHVSDHMFTKDMADETISNSGSLEDLAEILDRTLRNMSKDSGVLH